ncbi:MAG: cation transporter, partial [Chloroflexi bacterium]|nr:cation transporter [Chloroflexota bacterium]
MATQTTIEQITLPIKGMTCAACVSHVSNALNDVEGVDGTNVNLATEKATVTLGQSVDLGDLVYALEDAGYGVGTQEVTLSIGGLVSADTASQVETALQGIEGVNSAEVILSDEQATIEYIPGVTGISDLRKAVQDAGFSVLAVIGDEDD